MVKQSREAPRLRRHRCREEFPQPDERFCQLDRFASAMLLGGSGMGKDMRTWLDCLPEGFRPDLSLQRIWTLVDEAEIG